MSKSQYLCATSAAAVLLAATAAQAQAPAARAPAAPANTEVTEVVVTGSFIAGTPEDAAIPVEAVTLEELRQQGTPSNMDLIKSLSEIGSVAGEANRGNLFAVGAQSVNLRGVGSSRTVAIFNGRRLPEQYSASVGRFNNIALIPNAAIGRVEVLKDGGATTYGADAVGGVINYITRKNLNGLEMNANYRYIRDSDGGDYDADVIWGKVADNWNVMFVAGYAHRSEVDVADRSFALQPYLENPSGWSTYGSPGSYAFQRSTAPNVFASITPTAVATTGNRFAGDLQMSSTGLVRDPNCAAVGGFPGFSGTPSPICFFQSNLTSNLVEETDTYQGYAEFNYKFDNGIKFHSEALIYKLDIPHIPLDNFTNIPLNFPLNPASPTGATQVVGVSSAYVVSGANPAVRDLLNSLRSSNATLAFGDPNVTGTQAFNIINGGRVGLVTAAWRPFGYGGTPTPDLDEQHNYSTTWRITGELSGDLPEFLGFELKASAAATFTGLSYDIKGNDMLVERLQAALNGLGGPGCTGTTPGANGCMYFNPFSSGIRGNVLTGQVNPGYVATGSFTGYTPGQGLTNSPELIRWMYVPFNLHRRGEFSIYDFVISGRSPFKLWADDNIELAIGAQYRYFREEVELSEFADRAINPCATVGVQTCVTRTGPLVNSRGTGTTGFGFDQDRRYPVVSTFFEIRAPILNNLTTSISGRYEKFYSDVTDINNHVFVPQASAKWQINDWFAVRGTVGETFSQVDPPAARAPLVAANVSAPAALGGTAVQFTSFNYPNLGVKPETGFNYNVGGIFVLGNFRLNVDYYHLKIKDLIRAQTTAQLVNALVQPGQQAAGAAARINCQSPLLSETQDNLAGLPFIVLNGPCTATSALNSPAGQGGLIGGAVNFYGTQGSQTALVNGGDLTTSGIDISASYRIDDLFGGQATISGDLTQVLRYRASDYVVGGITVAAGYNGIDQTNELTGRNQQRIARNRGSVSFNYRKGRHSFNWSTRFISHLINDDTTNFVETIAQNANIGTNGVVPSGAACTDTNPTSPPVPAGAGTGVTGALGPTTFGGASTTIGFCPGQNTLITSGQRIPSNFNSDFSYNVRIGWDTTLTLTVQNVFDKDPQFARTALGYDSGVGSPLGRTFRVGARKIF